ncbi:hypothetical protein RchiOBHm_Chr2g0156391 [Rosa chinensis]|uniref:Uncharacterized protein n=1 Tax=Rosa chinensis TaxID=74649 RepID=A0A2P6S1F9_ROSCH|nr:hypothetical protein RchiOBHm_Chr2g0156391 [Rosa chinensis]
MFLVIAFYSWILERMECFKLHIPLSLTRLLNRTSNKVRWVSWPRQDGI